MKCRLVLSAFFLIGTAAIAADHAPDIVAERQSSMKEMARAAKTIAGMFEGKLDYDAGSFKAAAETIRRNSGDALIAQFTTGSLGGTSGATAEIEGSRAEFEELARHLHEFASTLSEATKAAPDGVTEDMRMAHGNLMGSSLLGSRARGADESDPSQIPAEHVFHLMLQDCTGCHAKFREKVQ
jgi:cytochrome c556